MEQMTLRDQIACRAVTSCMSYTPASLWQYIRWLCGYSYKSNNFDAKVLARNAYALADAMLEVRGSK